LDIAIVKRGFADVELFRPASAVNRDLVELVVELYRRHGFFENNKLKRLLADALLDNAALKDVVSRK
jgi:hypothetical protein